MIQVTDCLALFRYLLFRAAGTFNQFLVTYVGYSVIICVCGYHKIPDIFLKLFLKEPVLE